jgi:excisionase family DNA binding protein
MSWLAYIILAEKNMQEHYSENGQWLKVKDVAEILHVSRNMVHELTNTGELPCLRFGKVKRVWEKDMLDFIARHMTFSDNDSGEENNITNLEEK